MKTRLLPLLLLLCLPLSAKQVLEEAKLSNGKTIIVYTDKTWEYKTSQTSTSATAAPKVAGSKTSTKSSYSGSSGSNSYSGLCGARTKKGGSCQRKVSGGGYCWQHRK